MTKKTWSTPSLTTLGSIQGITQGGVKMLQYQDGYVLGDQGETIGSPPP